MRLLDLFCGAGGSAVGYHRAGFDEIVGVDNRPQPRYPFQFIQADALEYCAAHGNEFDVIHASPPCQAYIALANLKGRKINHPDLIDPTRKALTATGVPFVIENVQGSPLHTSLILCGHALDLKRLARHRHFETSILIPSIACTHRRQPNLIGVYGMKPDGRRLSSKRYRLNVAASSLIEAQRAMGIDWMDWREITQAIPPAYTEYIGCFLLEAIKGRA